MLRTLVLACLACSLGGCVRTPAARAPAPAGHREHPAWLTTAGAEQVAMSECLRARGGGVVVHVEPLGDGRVGVATLGDDGFVERCVHDRARLLWRSRDAKMTGPDFHGRAVMVPGARRPDIGTAPATKVLANGVVVAWVYWLNRKEAQP